MRLIKNAFLILIIALAIPAGVNAQFKAGLRMGINPSQIHGDQMWGFHKFGIVGGLYVARQLDEKWGLQFEMLYSQKGSQRVISPERIESGPWDKLSLHYIEVPVMVNYHVRPKLIINAGLGWAYLFDKNLIDASGPWLKDRVDFIRKNELSGNIGGNYDFASRWSLYAKYTTSLLPINKGSNTLAYFQFRSGMISAVASFGVYYHFNKNKE